MFHNPQKTTHWILSLALGAVTCIGTAMAQSGAQPEPPSATAPTGPSDPSVDAAQHRMNNYLVTHPGVADELHKDPSLINNPTWLASHPEVQNFMTKHPDLQKTAASNPNAVVNRAETSGLKDAHHGLNETDHYLSQHPEMAKQLAANPKLIDDPKFLAEHPGLDQELKTHPEIRQDAMQHPDLFKKAVERNNTYNQRRAKAAPAPKR